MKLLGEFPQVYLVRHGETAWSLSRQATGRTDIPLTENGEQTAHELRSRLMDLSFAQVLSSPLQRARRTAELAGFGKHVDVEALAEHLQIEGRNSFGASFAKVLQSIATRRAMLSDAQIRVTEPDAVTKVVPDAAVADPVRRGGRSQPKTANQNDWHVTDNHGGVDTKVDGHLGSGGVDVAAESISK